MLRLIQKQVNPCRCAARWASVKMLKLKWANVWQYFTAKDCNSATWWIRVIYTKDCCLGDEQSTTCLLPHVWKPSGSTAVKTVMETKNFSQIPVVSFPLPRGFVTLTCFCKEVVRFLNRFQSTGSATFSRIGNKHPFMLSAILLETYQLISIYSFFVLYWKLVLLWKSEELSFDKKNYFFTQRRGWGLCLGKTSCIWDTVTVLNILIFK